MTGASWPQLMRRISARLYVDVGPPDATAFIAGMGRSGTTWVAAVVNHDSSYRVMFEPFRPHHVPAAEVFGPFAYVRPGDRDPARVRAAEEILSGRTPRGTVDRENRGRIFRRRIVKEIRCNLMLGFLVSIRPAMPLILVVRHPFSVAASWLRLGWGMVAGGSRAELDEILDHESLLEDYPSIRQALPGIDRSDAFERTVFQWCLLHMVPARQLRAGHAHVICYEAMIREPDATVDRLAGYLGTSIAGASRTRALSSATETDFLGRGSDADRVALLTDWKRVLTARQVDRGLEILATFDLDRLYDENGLPSPTLASGTLSSPGASVR